MLRIVLPSLLLLAALAPAADAQAIGIEFKFNQLQFKFWPNGLENKPESDGKGSAITVHVDQATVDGEDAIELRHCIDGDSDYCSYTLPGGDNDGKVEANEVEEFQNFAKIGLAGAVPKVKNMINKLKANMTVDGLTAKGVKITDVIFIGAEGAVSSDKTITVNIDAKATYDNDGKAAKHVIRMADLSLFKEGFEYQTVTWSSADSAFGWDKEQTKPESAKAFINPLGYYSNQVQFEQLSGAGLEFTIAKGAAAGGKKSPGLEVSIVLLTALAVVAVARRHHP